jgi:hypothetical protein
MDVVLPAHGFYLGFIVILEFHVGVILTLGALYDQTHHSLLCNSVIVLLSSSILSVVLTCHRVLQFQFSSCSSPCPLIQYLHIIPHILAPIGSGMLFAALTFTPVSLVLVGVCVIKMIGSSTCVMWYIVTRLFHREEYVPFEFPFCRLHLPPLPQPQESTFTATELQSVPPQVYRTGTLDDDMCAVCIQSMEEGSSVRVLSCRHVFHVQCIDEWLVRKKRCPMCIQEVVL